MNMSNQVVFEGVESFNNLLIHLKEKKKKLFIVTGKGTFIKSGAKNKILRYLNNEDYFIFNKFSSNPKIEDVYYGLDKFRSFKASIILAIGGGSAMDIAKLIHGANEYKSKFEKNIIKGINLKKKGCDIYFVPTTTGSGSEATNFAVVYINNKKFSATNLLFIPKGICLDPILCMSMDTNQRAISGFDAFCQAIESLWAIEATKESKQYAHQSLALITSNIYMNVNFPNIENTKAMLKASHMSGKAINISKTTVAHALSYYLTTNHNIPHGHAVSLFLGIFLKAHDYAPSERINNKIGIKLFKQNLKEIFIYLKCDNGLQAKKNWDSFMESCGLSSNLDFILENKIERKALIESVNTQRLMNNPVNYNKLELLQIFKN